MTEPLPAPDQIRHPGGGETGTVVTLSAGTHRLQLRLGDKSHIPHAPPVMSPRITVILR